MKSPTSLWNKTLIRHFITQTFWITVLYTVMSLIVIPFGLWISSFSMAESEGFDSGELQKTVAWIHLAFGMLYAVILGVFSVNFKNKENISDFIHSLPVKRVTVLTSVYIVGILSIMIPTILIAVILMFQRYILFFEVAVSDVLSWLIYSVTMMIITFSFTVLAGFFTNNLFVHMQLVVIMFFLPLALWTATVTTASMIFDGFDGVQDSFEGDLLSPVANNTFPIVGMSQIFGPFSLLRTAVWVGAALAGIVLSYFLYSRRKNENVNYNFTYYAVRMIVSVLITILGMLLFGYLMGLILSDNVILRGISFALGWIFSYIIVEMLFQSTVKIQLSVKNFVISIASVISFMIIFYSGWTMYVTYTPETDEVQSVRINEGYLYKYDESGVVMNDGFMMVQDDEYIQDVLEAHQYAVDHRTQKDTDRGSRKFEVIYNMTDGDWIHRTFHNFPAGDEGLELLHALRDYPKLEFEDVIYNIAHAGNIRSLSLNYHGQNPVQISDESEMEQFVEDYESEFENAANDNPSLLQMESEQPLNVELRFSNGVYEETVDGRSMIYNHAVITKVSERMEFSEFISLDRAENVYIYEVTGEAEGFYDDLRYSTFDELRNKYDIEELGDGQKTEIIEAVNKGNITAHSDRILIYDNPDHYPHYESYEYDVPEWTEDTHFIIGME